MNLAEVLAATAARQPDDAAIVHGDRRITFAELEAEAERIASALAGLGADAGDRIALWLPNHPAFASAMYGSWRMGGIVVPVHSMLTGAEARHILSDSGARVLICGAQQYASVRERLDDLPDLEHVVVLDGEGPGDGMPFEEFAGSGSGELPPVERAEDHLALIAYTSGTSGLPKGAMLTHRNLWANLEQMRSVPVAATAGDVSLCVLPLFHIFGLNVVLNLSVDVGATVVILERFDPTEALEAIREHRVTVVAAAPPAYVAWLGLPDATREDFATVRVAVSGAAPLPREALQGFRERFGVTIWEGYGLTETAPVLTSTSVGGVPKAGSIGRPLAGVELRLVNEDAEDVEPGDPGEVVVRGPNVFRGYWRHPEENEGAFLHGWFRTGDVAVADDEGDLFLVDRRKDMIIVSGFNVYPREVELALHEHPAVSDCAVVGAPDPYSGEQVVAYVALTSDGSATPEELQAWCTERLAPYKVPSRVDVVDEIPRNIAGKVLRREFRD